MSISYFGDKQFTKELFYEQLVDSPPGVIGVDVETVSLKERIPIGFAVATSPTDSFYFRTYPEADPEAELLKPLLNNPRITKVFHNAIFDMRIFPLIYNIDESNIADTNVMARLLGYQETKLSILAEELLLITLRTAQELMTEYGKKTMLGVPTEAVSSMCCSHAKATLQLYNKFASQVDKDYLAVEMAVIPILIDMSLRGMKVNQHDRARLEAKLEKEVAYYKEICEAEDFNPASNQQVGYMLAKRGNFLPFTKSRKNLKVDVEQLEFLDDPLAAAVLGFRRANKRLTTYVKPLATEDRIYTNYNLDAVVGRVSSSDRNLQNIPQEDRHIYEPDTGTYTTGDFAQEHLYILMYKSGDKQMERIYYDGEFDGDIHLFTAGELNITRRLAKTINYAVLYGATAKTISFHSKIRDIQRCSRLLDKWFDTFRDAAYWIQEVQKEGLNSGWAEPTLFGRRIRIPEELNRWGRVDEEAMKRKAVNYPILGSDGEVMKRALIICERERLPLAVTVHDSVTCDGNIEFPIEELETIAPVRIPFKVTKSERWE